MSKSKSAGLDKIEVNEELPGLIFTILKEDHKYDDQDNYIRTEIKRVKLEEKITLQQLTPDRIPQLVDDIISKHKKYISVKNADDIERYLLKLKKKIESLPQPLPNADINNLEEYIELLYQITSKNSEEKEKSLNLQIQGTRFILQLSRSINNLEVLIQNNTLMGALTRILQEEFKKSIDLTFNILRIFLSFSNFSQMHSILANYKVGALTMKSIDYEIKRRELRNSEMESLKKESKSMSDAEYKSQLNEYKVITKKQDKLFFVAFYILINLAEDIGTEKKMLKKSLISYLVDMLDHKYEDLLILSLTFLKKLSIYEENKEELKNYKIIEKLYKFLACSSFQITFIVLRLLFNLSFDKEMREEMFKCNYYNILISLLKQPKLRGKVLKLLYHLSVDDRFKAYISTTEGLGILMNMIINFPQDYIGKELAGLVVNLSFNSKNVEAMIEKQGLNLLIDRFCDKRDPLLMKIIRNISLWSFNLQQSIESPEVNYKCRIWSPHIRSLLDIMLEEQNQDIVYEIAGTLANLTIYDVPNSYWQKMLKETSLFNFITRCLTVGFAKDDLLLEVILLVSNMACDQKICVMFIKKEIPQKLYQILREKYNDLAISLNIFNAFHKFLLNTSVRDSVLKNVPIHNDIILALTHTSQIFRNKAEQMCEILLECDRDDLGNLGTIGKTILAKRFENYNQAWITNVIGEAQQSHLSMNNMNGNRYRANSEQELLQNERYFNNQVDRSMKWVEDDRYTSMDQDEWSYN